MPQTHRRTGDQATVRARHRLVVQEQGAGAVDRKRGASRARRPLPPADERSDAGSSLPWAAVNVLGLPWVTSASEVRCSCRPSKHTAILCRRTSDCSYCPKTTIHYDEFLPLEVVSAQGLE